MNTQQSTITGIASLASTTEAAVVESLMKASPQELRDIKNAANAVGVFLKNSTGISEDDQVDIALSALLATVEMGGAPPADFSAMADELEKSAATVH